jgi:hypothetical protein
MNRQSSVKAVAYLFHHVFRNTSVMLGSPQRGVKPSCSGIQVMFVAVVLRMSASADLALLLSKQGGTSL